MCPTTVSQNITLGFEAVEATGFRVARTNPGIEPVPVPQRGLFQKISDDVLHVPPAVRETQIGVGLILHTSSLFLNWGGRIPPLRRYVTLIQAMRSLQRTAKGIGDTHFRLHPFNLAITPNLLEGLTALLRKAAKLKDQGMFKI